MPRWGMVIDLDRCTGCQACSIACAVENNVAPPSPGGRDERRPFTWLRLLTQVEGSFPKTRVQLLPRPCMQCDRPPCVAVCPVNATNIDSEGLVRQVYPRCIGCRYCTTACPYTVRYFNWHTPTWPEPLEEGLSPDVSVRPSGVVEKCTFCHHRLQRARDAVRAEERELRPEDYQPACVESCPARAMIFGDLDDADSAVARLARSPRAFRLLEELGTEPKVVYLREGE
ncbi:MAG: 4Fe-4S dicluster domain-containing protein [Acidobacteriota bacterium]